MNKQELKKAMLEIYREWLVQLEKETEVTEESSVLVPPPQAIPSQEECAEILREAAEPPKKRGRPAKARVVEQAPTEVTICSPEPEKAPEIQPHHHELAADLGGTVESITREDLTADFDGNNPDHKALVSEWAKEAAVDSQWKRCYATHIFNVLLKGKKTGEVYATLDGFLRDLNAAERLNKDYQKNIVGK